MLASAAVMVSALSSSRLREKVWSARTSSMFSTRSRGSTVSPVSSTEETVYCSPSVRPTVRNMSCLSGLIATCWESMLKSA